MKTNTSPSRDTLKKPGMRRPLGERTVMNKVSKLTLLAFVIVVGPALADELTLTVEQDLTRLGYGTGEADGEETVETVIAIAKYQAEHNFEITGEVTQELVQALSATERVGDAPAIAALQPDPSAAVVVSEAGLRAAREACLKEKMLVTRATESNEGLNEDLKDEMIDQAARMAIQASNLGLLQQVYNVYSQWDSRSDSDAPKESETGAIASSLGISEDDVTACQRPAG